MADFCSGPGIAGASYMVGIGSRAGGNMARGMPLRCIAALRRTDPWISCRIGRGGHVGSVFGAGPGIDLCAGRAAGESVSACACEMVAEDCYLCRIPRTIQPTAHISAGWRQSSPMSERAVSSSGDRTKNLLLVGMDLLGGIGCAVNLRLFWPWIGPVTDAGGSRYHLAHKNTLQTLEKFGTMEP